MPSWLHLRRERGALYRVVVLTGLVIGVHGLLSPWIAMSAGRSGFWAATLAAGLCLLGAAAGAVISDLLKGPQNALPALWLGMMARAVAPFLCGIAIHLTDGPLARAGILYYLLIYYPFTLAAVTYLALPVSRPAARSEAPLSGT